MNKTIQEIRNEILKSVESEDKLAAKFAINDLDTYITKQNRVKSESISDVISWQSFDTRPIECEEIILLHKCGTRTLTTYESDEKIGDNYKWLRIPANL